MNSAYDFAGKTYDFYALRFGRNSIDDAATGLGLPLISAVRYCPADDVPRGPGARSRTHSWDGKQMTYGDGYADADDVVAHELTHGVTEDESNLLYWYESGAINESMSDVMGQFVDLGDNDAQDTNLATRWQIGEDLPGGAIRDMADPQAFGQPAKTSDVEWDSDWLDVGGVHANSGVGNKAAYLITDGTVNEPGGTFNGHTVTGLGLDKAAAIYYRAEQTLTSGSDYRDLYNILRGSCTALVDTFPNDKNGDPISEAITAADCDQVTAAVTAVQMNVYPTHDAKIPTAPGYCATGYTVTNLLLDNFETGTNWTSSGAWALSQDYQPTATSGFAAYVPDYEDTGAHPSDGHTERPEPHHQPHLLDSQRAVLLPEVRPRGLVRLDRTRPFPPTAVLRRRFRRGVCRRGGLQAAQRRGERVQPQHRPDRDGSRGVRWRLDRLVHQPGDHELVRRQERQVPVPAADRRHRLGLGQSYGWWLDNVRLYSCRGPGAPASVAVKNKKGTKAKLKWSAATANPGFSIASYVVKRSGKSAGDGECVEAEEGLQAPQDRPDVQLHDLRQEQRWGGRHRRHEAPQDHLTDRVRRHAGES